MTYGFEKGPIKHTFVKVVSFYIFSTKNLETPLPNRCANMSANKRCKAHAKRRSIKGPHEKKHDFGKLTAVKKRYSYIQRKHVSEKHPFSMESQKRNIESLPIY